MSSFATDLKKYRKTAAVTASSYVREGPLFLFYFALRFLRIALLLTIWRMVFAGRGEVDGLRPDVMLTYVLIAEVFADQFLVETTIVNTMWEGTITTRLLQPLPVEGIFTAEMIGQWSIGWLFVSLPMLLLAPLWGVNPLPASPAAGAWFLFSLVLAITLGVAVDFLFGAITIALNINVWILDQFRAAVGSVFSGAFLPLALMPWGLGKVFAWLPFAAMASAPLRIYTGTGNAPVLVAIQAGWCLLLWPPARWAWAKNRERLMSFGG
jgi:ABC-2 type transport system permease protein